MNPINLGGYSLKSFPLLNRLSKYTIRQQLYIIYFPIIFLFTLLTGFLLVSESQKKLTESYKELSALNAQRTKSIVFDTTNKVFNGAESFANDAELRKILSTNYSSTLEAEKEISHYNLFNQLTNLDTSIKSLKVYTTNPTISNYQNFVKADSEILQTSWFNKGLQTADVFWLTSASKVNNMKKIYHNLTLYKAIPLPLSNYSAILEIKIDYNFLKNRLSSNNYGIQLQLNDDPLFYSNIEKEVGSQNKFDTPFSENYYQSEQFFGKQLVATNAILLSNKTDKIYIYSIDETSYSALRANLIKWLIILAFSLLTTTLIVILFSNFFSQRIQDLKNAVHHASIEDYDYLIKDNGQDEISDIFLDFHTVINSILTKDKAVLEAKLAEKEFLNIQQQMEFKLLSSQINPHFLFNTLETIRMLALSEGNQEVNQAIQLLAKLMRHTLESPGSHMISLEADLEYIENYIKIQQLRFGDRVNYSIQLASDIDPKRIEILPLLIQPIIENSIEHGLEGINKTGYISILIKKIEEHILVIEIADNGIGIEKEKLISLISLIETSSKDEKENIGLRNVNSRLKMHYGNTSGLTIDSTYGVGTTVTLTIDNQSLLEFS